MKFDPHAYTITTRKVTRDGVVAFKGTVAELPHLATYEDTPQEAYDTLIEDIAALYEAARHEGRTFPEPQGETADDYTGRVTLRLPRSLHRRLAEMSRDEDVSLNTCLVALLSQSSAAKSIVSSATAALADSIHSTVKAAKPARDVIRRGKTTASYSATARITLAEGEPPWASLH